MSKSITKLIANYPDLLRDFHRDKNNIDINIVSIHSREQIHWLCPAGHEYKVSPFTRYRVGCKICKKKEYKNSFEYQKIYARKYGSLQDRNPEILNDWDYEKNDALGIKPSDITSKSQRLVNWKCENNHFYELSPKNKFKNKHCPICYEENITKILSKQIRESRLKKGETLLDIYPLVAKEWDYKKNELKPEDYSPHSNFEASWICKFDHSWSATIDNRTGKNSGCPHCKLAASRLEIFVFSELKYLFNETKLKSKIDGKEADIFIPELNIAIEIDGAYWHKNKEEKDIEKDKVFIKNNIKCFRLREFGLKSISERCVEYRGSDYFSIIKKLFSKILKEINNEKIYNYKNIQNPLNPNLFNEIYANLPAPIYENSLEYNYPELSKEWDYEINKNLKPSMFSAGSDQKVAWKCNKCNHRWNAVIKNRTLRASKCPECSKKNRRHQTM